MLLPNAIRGPGGEAELADDAMDEGYPDEAGSPQAVGARLGLDSAADCAWILQAAGNVPSRSSANAAVVLTYAMTGTDRDAWTGGEVAAALQGAHRMGCEEVPYGGEQLLDWVV